ncbi:MAG: hypothetical protein QOH09_498 [Pseudonocardiales bacterium]|nr:hypothetical protein [Pseudonocardiales bacterium]
MDPVVKYVYINYVYINEESVRAASASVSPGVIGAVESVELGRLPWRLST